MVILRIPVFYRIITMTSEVWHTCYCFGLGQKQWYELYVFLYFNKWDSIYPKPSIADDDVNRGYTIADIFVS